MGRLGWAVTHESESVSALDRRRWQSAGGLLGIASTRLTTSSRWDWSPLRFEDVAVTVAASPTPPPPALAGERGGYPADARWGVSWMQAPLHSLAPPMER